MYYSHRHKYTDTHGGHMERRHEHKREKERKDEHESWGEESLHTRLYVR